MTPDVVKCLQMVVGEKGINHPLLRTTVLRENPSLLHGGATIHIICPVQTWSESESPSVVSNSLQPHRLYSPWNSLWQNTRVGSLSLLQRIFPTQGSNPGLPLCRQICYQLSHKGSPGILEWVAYPFSSRSSRSKNQPRVSCIAGGFFTNWVIREAPIYENVQCYQQLLNQESAVSWC